MDKYPKRWHVTDAEQHGPLLDPHYFKMLIKICLEISVNTKKEQWPEGQSAFVKLVTILQNTK